MVKGLRNISIETITNGFVPDGVIVFDEVIHYVGTPQNLPSFNKPIEWMDGGGAVAFPGLIDVHTHLGINEEGIGIEGDSFNELSSAVTPQIRVIDGINPFDEGYYRALMGGVTTVQVVPGSSNIIGGLTAIIKVKPGRPVEEQVLQSPSGLKIAFGENPILAHRNVATTRMGVAAVIREAFWHAKKNEGIAPATMAEEAMQYVLAHHLSVKAHAHQADDILTAIRIAKEFGLNLTIVHATDSLKILPQIKSSGYDVVLGPTMMGKLKVELANLSWEVYRAFEEAGIPFTITTDHPVVPIDELLTEARRAMSYGLSEKTAAEAITIQAARQLNLSDRIGSLEIGKDADIVLWSANPLKDFKAKPVMIFIDGEQVF
ncbi:amidohydrolase family protein [Jeotgalibacillus proteolyticus]|uniref:amidohydrolase family protein n=1 Tax=Jeotgalibacillus proteolyticus TaxID=2082395 RepID=UPI0014312075|nr:amidohydrolase family protein [Jeotgalibacillus proteolyticus]